MIPRCARDKVGWIELPAIYIGIPRIPRHDRRHAIAQMRRDHFGNDERFLPAQLVRITELETEDAEDVAGDVPGGLRVPAVRNFHDDTETFRILGMFDRQSE